MSIQKHFKLALLSSQYIQKLANFECVLINCGNNYNFRTVYYDSFSVPCESWGLMWVLNSLCVNVLKFFLFFARKSSCKKPQETYRQQHILSKCNLSREGGGGGTAVLTREHPLPVGNSSPINQNCHSRSGGICCCSITYSWCVILPPLEKPRPLTQQPKLKPHFASSFNGCHLALHSITYHHFSNI